MRLHVVYEDNHLLVVNKPALLPTMGIASNQTSLVSIAKQYLKQKYAKPGNVYLGVVSRLDAWVTGIVILARTSKAAARLTAAFQSHAVEKTYWAIVAGKLDATVGVCEDCLRKDESQRRMVTCRPDHPESVEARLTYRVIQSWPDRELLEIQLETGRKHQIRVQFASRRHPIWGDRKYGSRHSFSPGIALHSRRLRLTHPVRQVPLEFVAELPRSWHPFGIRARLNAS